MNGQQEYRTIPGRVEAQGRYYRVERRFAGRRSTADMLHNLVQAHS